MAVMLEIYCDIGMGYRLMFAHLGSSAGFSILGEGRGQVSVWSVFIISLFEFGTHEGRK